MTWKEKIKGYFITGKIPTQAQFAELIDKIPSTDNSYGGVIDNTLNFFNPNNPNINGYRFVNYSDTASYIFINVYDASQAISVPWLIIKCETGSPTEYGGTVPVYYAILTSEQMMSMYLDIGDTIENIQDNSLVDGIPAEVIWKPIMDNAPSIRTITQQADSDWNSYTVYPAYYNNQWVIGYIIACTIKGGAGSSYSLCTVQGNMVYDFNSTDSTILQLINTGKFNVKPL